jgi:PTH1 family peptidyl-tRNA hydrolase
VNVIVGLGNPGRTYHHTRHNVGFMVIELLATRHAVSVTERVIHPADQRPAAVYGQYRDGDRTVRLLMPLTMMNEAGDALKATGMSPKDLLLVCDDVNLPLGTIRLRPQGSAGGHHGLESCLAVLGTDDVARLRVGVGAPDMPRDLEGFVLSRFRNAELPLIRQAAAQAAEACETWVREGIEVAMNRYNTTARNG